MADAHSITTTKRCSKCGETKLIDNFGFQKRRKDGRNPWCRACKSIAGKEYEARYKERRETQRKNWLDANRDKHNAYHREYSKKNRERVHAAWKKWRDKNPEKVLQWARDDYWRNREARLASAKAWREANPEKWRIAHMVWVTANKELVSLHKRAYKARRRSADGKFTPQDIEKLKELQRNRCACCRDKLKEFHIDHRVALARGGSNDPSNLQLLCPPCNMRKHAKDPVDYMQSLGFLL